MLQEEVEKLINRITRDGNEVVQLLENEQTFDEIVDRIKQKGIEKEYFGLFAQTNSTARVKILNDLLDDLVNFEQRILDREAKDEDLENLARMLIGANVLISIEATEPDPIEDNLFAMAAVGLISDSMRANSKDTEIRTPRLSSLVKKVRRFLTGQ